MDDAAKMRRLSIRLRRASKALTAADPQRRSGTLLLCRQPLTVRRKTNNPPRSGRSAVGPLPHKSRFIDKYGAPTLLCLLNISKAIYDGRSNTKACPFCARKIRARLTRCLHPTRHRWSAAPAKTRRRVWAGAASGANGDGRSRRTRYRVYPSRTRSIFSPQRSASFRLFPIASLPKLQAPDACGASLPIDIEIPPNAGIALHSGGFDPYCYCPFLQIRFRSCRHRRRFFDCPLVSVPLPAFCPKPRGQSSPHRLIRQCRYSVVLLLLCRLFSSVSALNLL